MKKTTTTSPKPRAKKTTVKKVAVKKVTKVTKKAPRVSAAKASNKVDYYPNRMTVAISALAGTMIVLLALIAVLGSR